MKKFYILLLVILSVFSFASCKRNDVIKIGFANSLEFNFGNLGIDSMYGALIAVDEINKAGGINGREIELIIKDDKRTVEEAIKVDNELKEEGVVAIIGHGYSLTAEKIAENAINNDILLVSPTIATELVSNEDDNFFRVTPSTKEQGETLAILAHQETPGDVLVIYESVNEAFSMDLVNAFINQYQSYGYTVPTENIKPFKQNDFDDYVEVKNFLESNDIKNVLAVGSSFDIGNIVQILDQPEEYTFLLPAWTTTSDIFEFSSTKIEGSYSINFYNFNNPNSKLASLATRYFQEFGRDVSYSSILAYEAVYLLKDVLESTNDYSTANLKQLILEKQVYQGVMDDYYINEYGDSLRRVYFYLLEDGEFKTIGYEDYEEVS